MTAGAFISFAQNAEDVILRRALGHLPRGNYVDVGAFDPQVDSVTYHLYQAGWRGINVEPVPAFHAAMVEGRPEDVNVRVAAGAAPGELTFHVIPETGLSTLRADIATRHATGGRDVEQSTVEVRTLDSLLDEHLPGAPLHLLKIDVEGAEADVLAGLDLTRHRPWVVLVEATEPTTTEPSHAAWEAALLDHDYRFCLFDGLSRWYVAAEHAAELGPALSYPACVFDDFLPARAAAALQSTERARELADLWRDEALEHAIMERTLQAQLLEVKEQIAEIAARKDLLKVTEAERAEARWQADMYDRERVWLRGLLAEATAAAEAAQAHAGPAAGHAPDLLTRVARRARRSLTQRSLTQRSLPQQP